MCESFACKVIKNLHVCNFFVHLSLSQVRHILVFLLFTTSRKMVLEIEYNPRPVTSLFSVRTLDLSLLNLAIQLLIICILQIFFVFPTPLVCFGARFTVEPVTAYRTLWIIGYTIALYTEAISRLLPYEIILSKAMRQFDRRLRFL